MDNLDLEKFENREGLSLIKMVEKQVKEIYEFLLFF